MKPISLHRVQAGVSILAAIFLLLLFAGLAALMANFRSVSELTSAEDVLGIRANLAARSGIEWGLFKVMDPNNPSPLKPSPAPGPDNLPSCPSSSLPPLPQFPGFTVSVDCFETAYDEGTRRLRIYYLVATATVAGPAGTIERRIEATVEKCRDSASVTSPFDC